LGKWNRSLPKAPSHQSKKRRRGKREEEREVGVTASFHNGTVAEGKEGWETISPEVRTGTFPT
jgi:hypothetical protein